MGCVHGYSANPERQWDRAARLLQVAIEIGCYFCFFQQRREWVGLFENHKDLFDKAAEFEKNDLRQGNHSPGYKARAFRTYPTYYSR